MLRVEEAFRAHILDTTTVTNLIDKRFYTHHAPQNRPGGAADGKAFCVQTIVSDVTDQLLDGPGAFALTRLQIDIMAKGIVNARKIEKAIREQCDGWHGTVTAQDSDGDEDSIIFHNMRWDGSRTSYEYSDDETGWDVVTMDWILNHPQTVPGYIGR